MNHVKEQMNALENRIARDKVNTRYRVMVSDTLTKNQVASLIADAILFEPEAVQLVARRCRYYDRQSFGHVVSAG